jgi:hypothetical protein
MNKIIACPVCDHDVALFSTIEVDGERICMDCFNDSYFVCECCGTVCDRDELNTDYDIDLCQDCADNAIGTCVQCGRIVSDGDDYWVDEYDDDVIYCEECYPEVSFVCQWCNDRYHTDCMHSDGNISICDNCMEDAVICDGCGDIVSSDDAREHNDNYYCESCYEEHRDRCPYIHSYGYTPELQFLRIVDDPRPAVLYGIELEADMSDDVDEDYDLRNDCATEIDSDYGDMVWMTTDGSLSEVGIEVKSMPATYDYHMNVLPWDRLLKTFKKYDYCSHRAGNCGLHIHISKTAFGESKAIQDGNIAKFLYMIEKFWDQMTIFSRRSRDSIRQWARQYELANTSDTHSISSEAYDKNMHSRHYCVNLMRHQTIEVRLFRGTLNTVSLKAALQLCDLMRNISMDVDLQQIHEMSWPIFKDYAAKGNYPELMEYMEKRGL